jgi:hypothetical protein
MYYMIMWTTKDFIFYSQLFIIRYLDSKRNVWRYKSGNKKPLIGGQILQLPKTKDWVTRATLETAGEPRCYGRVSSSLSISDTLHVTLVTIE